MRLSDLEQAILSELRATPRPLSSEELLGNVARSYGGALSLVELTRALHGMALQDEATTYENGCWSLRARRPSTPAEQAPHSQQLSIDLSSQNAERTTPDESASSPTTVEKVNVAQQPHLVVELDHRINFAMQQNDVPVVKEIRIENTLDSPLREIRLIITPEPAFADALEIRIDMVAPESTYNLDAVDLKLSPIFLSELTERIRGQIRFELFSGDELCTTELLPVELLARDEWGGLNSLPEMLAAFVTPNHPLIDEVLREAGDLLGQATGDPSLSGYQSQNPKRVLQTSAAVYAALQSLGVTYSNPPASYELEGQRVRLPARIAESRLATCLDLALLAAACLEQAGLHALLVLVKEHAFVGVWLQEETFGEAAVTDPLRLRKRVDLREIAVFDPTCITSPSSVNFGTATREAKRRLEEPEDLHCVVDVSRARKGRIRPLPDRVARRSENPELTVTKPGGTDISSISAISDIPLPPQVVHVDSEPETATTRLDRWKRRLLDLSMRNRLLNFRDTKKTIPLLVADLPGLEDALAAGNAFKLLPRPQDMAAGDPRDPDAHRRRTGDEAIVRTLNDEMKARRLRADLSDDELDRRMIDVYRSARLGMEEGGASALYLAVGFLSWFETPQSEKNRLAPILLLPLELHRRSVREGFTLKLGSDDPRINVTLLEMLGQEFDITIPGLDPLPEDESGLDVPLVLRTFRERVKDIDRWDVLDTSRVGIFTFSKFLMWRDLADRTEALKNSAVVDHLINRPDQEFDPDGTFPDPERLDEEHAPNETFCPLPADASQLAAIFAAAQGRSFVLEGPPGTGKSQTITNLIAHCLATGKTVLFVSEKMAALNVVFDRLQKVGLARHCLELHSNKAHKGGVLSQLGDALGQYETHSPEQWEAESERLAKLRSTLNAYVDALHRRRETGETAFQATSALIGLRKAQRVPLVWPSPDSVNAEALAQLRDLVDSVATQAAALGEVSGHAWSGILRADWTPAWQEDAGSEIQSTQRDLETLDAAATRASLRLSLGEEGWSQDELAAMDELAKVLLDSPAPPVAILVRPDWDEIHAQIGSWIDRGRTRDALRKEVFERFSERILTLELAALTEQLDAANQSWWPASFWRRRRVIKPLKGVSNDGKAPNKNELAEILERAQTLSKEEQALASASDEARALLGRYWKDGEPEWDGLENVRDWARSFRSLATRVAGDDIQRAAQLREAWAQLATEGRELLRRDGVIGREMMEYRSALEAFLGARQALDEKLEVDQEASWGRLHGADALGTASRTLRGWNENLAVLREWCGWRRVRARALRKNLGPLIEAYERGDFRSDELRQTFERSYYQWWHTAIVTNEPVLAEFISPEHERKIDQFRSLDETYMELTSGVIAARLAARVPASSGDELRTSEVGILKREVGKKSRRMAVRRLFQTIPHLLPRLKPCLLMSPMSVAQYMDADYPPFDIVVFDEASQIPVWDAVGAIARGKQAIIVGDPKQLPPTSFFERGDSGEDEIPEDGAVEDLESILKDCLSARLPWLHLNWHYRSRHESLIAFSNFHYYDNRLLTFPSPQREGMGVTWRHIPDGVYDRGKSATNRAEADAIVKEIVARLLDTNSNDSIGVVTFSQAQQRLVEDLLESARLADPAVDEFFSEEQDEPVFVKNLENVQGDERDIILFSICYGPDSLGRVAMNFGPMNREGGERRLNVAITRARKEVLVFSTLRSDQIDLAKTRARGVKDLKNFLAYAERGPSSIAEATQYDPLADFDSPFEKEVHSALADLGWVVHQQVGCARYRIDLAVVDPEAPGRYLLGIECDGANYHRAKTARDRDKLREGVLRGLGWELHRVWSTDWWTNPEREIEKMNAALVRAMEARSKGPERDPSDQDPAPVQASSTPAPPVPAPSPRQEAPSPPTYEPYRSARLLGTREEFYMNAAKREIRKKIAEVVNHEGPISVGLVARRVASHWGLERVRQKALDHVRSLIPAGEVKVDSTRSGVFLWPKHIEIERYQDFRVPGSTPESARDAIDIPPQEIANAAQSLLRNHISAPKADVVRETARLLGFSRSGSRVEAHVRAGVDLLVQRGSAELKGDDVVLVSD